MVGLNLIIKFNRKVKEVLKYYGNRNIIT